jgi:maltoporin
MGEIAYMEGNTYATNGSQIGSRSFGVNNHLLYTVNDKWSVGVRGEYHYSHKSTFDNARVTQVNGVDGQGGDLWEFTLAAQYKINPKTTLRPEIRYDYTDYNNGYRPFGGDSSKRDQLCGGVSFIVMF